MRHHKAGLKLNRTSSHRNAMFRNMVTSLFKHDRIRTTDTKAKELKRWADNLITLAKRGDLHARRRALSIVREKDVVHKLFNDVENRFSNTKSGYTRVVRLGRRPGDAAPMSLVELMSAETEKKKKERKKKKPAIEKQKPSEETREPETADVERKEAVKKPVPSENQQMSAEKEVKETVDTGVEASPEEDNAPSDSRS